MQTDTHRHLRAIICKDEPTYFGDPLQNPVRRKFPKIIISAYMGSAGILRNWFILTEYGSYRVATASPKEKPAKNRKSMITFDKILIVFQPFQPVSQPYDGEKYMILIQEEKQTRLSKPIGLSPRLGHNTKNTLTI